MKLLIITQTVDESDQLLGFFISWIRLFAEKFEKVNILCLNEGKNNFPANVRVICLGKNRGASKSIQLLNFYKYIIGSKNEYDAVFVHMNPIWMVLGGIFWRLAGKRSFLWYTSGGITFKLRLAEKFADVIFSASKESFRLPSKKVIVTGHGIDTDFFKPDLAQKNLSSRVKILSVGRISPVKNYEILINAAEILKNNNFDFEVTMIGEPALEGEVEYKKKLEKIIREKGLTDNFKFIGKVINKDIVKYYQSHDIFIHLSKTGSLDKVLLEAMASGIKVLSSSDSARAFLPSDLVFNENNYGELADKIIKLKNNSHPLDLRGYVVENHNLNALVNKLAKHING